MNQFVLAGLGIIYALTFWLVCAIRPKIALLLIVATAPMQWDVSGGGPLRFSMAEINLFLSVPLLLLAKRRILLGATFIPAMIYLLVGFLCSVSQWRDSTLSSLVQSADYMVVMVAVFATLARDEEDYRVALHGLLVVSVFFAICICIVRTPYLFGMHKNGIGGSLATGFVVAFALWQSEVRPKWKRRYLVASVILVLGMIITLSRGAWLGAFAGVLVIFALRRDFKMLLRTALAIMPIVAIGWFALPSQAREYASSVSSDNWNIKLRYQSVDYAMAQFHSSPIIGVGVGLRKEYDATNLLLVTLAETGVVGVAAFAAVQLTIAWGVWRAHRGAPTSSLSFALLAIAGAVSLGALVHGMVDHYWSRGSLTVAWATVGMAARVTYNQRAERRRQAKARAMARAAAEFISAAAPLVDSGPLFHAESL